MSSSVLKGMRTVCGHLVRLPTAWCVGSFGSIAFCKAQTSFGIESHADPRRSLLVSWSDLFWDHLWSCALPPPPPHTHRHLAQRQTPGGGCETTIVCMGVSKDHRLVKRRFFAFKHCPTTTHWSTGDTPLVTVQWGGGGTFC